MKHVFFIYNMANVDDHIYYQFIDKLKSEFTEFGYRVGDQISIDSFDKKTEYNNYTSSSAIVIATDSISDNSAKYGEGKDFWPYIKEKIDLILVSGKQPKIYWPSLLTPVLPLEKLNYTNAVGILINYNT